MYPTIVSGIVTWGQAGQLLASFLFPVPSNTHLVSEDSAKSNSSPSRF